MQANPAVDATSTAPHASDRACAPAHRRRVTDAPTRMFHWLFALSFVGAYLTAEGEKLRLLHVTLGYTMAGLLAFRVLYGLFGPRQAAIGNVWRKLGAAPAWLQSLRHVPNTQAFWRQGQNLLMALGVLLLMALVVPLTLSGYGTYNDWGDVLGGEWLEELHELMGNAMLIVVLAHVALIAGLSLLRGKNQASPMLSGTVEGKGPDLVKHNRGWLAALMLAAVLGFGAWQWVDSPNGLFSVTSFSRSASGDRHHGHRHDGD